MHFESPTPNPMGFALLAFAPALALVRAGGSRETVRICWFFVAGYLIYWGTILGMVRFAIAPLLLLCLFIGTRLEAVLHRPRCPLRPSGRY
jgi:hypothetical protein